jgi:hypothetical protein
MKGEHKGVPLLYVPGKHGKVFLVESLTGRVGAVGILLIAEYLEKMSYVSNPPSQGAGTVICPANLIKLPNAVTSRCSLFGRPLRLR